MLANKTYPSAKNRTVRKIKTADEIFLEIIQNFIAVLKDEENYLNINIDESNDNDLDFNPNNIDFKMPNLKLDNDIVIEINEDDDGFLEIVCRVSRREVGSSQKSALEIWLNLSAVETATVYLPRLFVWLNRKNEARYYLPETGRNGVPRTNK